MRSLAGDKNEKKEKDKNAVTAQTIGKMLAAEKCLQSSLEVRGGYRRWKGQEITVMDILFSAEEQEPEQLCPESPWGSACTYATP